MIIANIIWKLTYAHSCRPLLEGGGGGERGSILIRGSTTIVQSTLMMISLRIYKRQMNKGVNVTFFTLYGG